MTVATRLAEANFSVALVEAGGFYENAVGNRTVTPGYYAENLGNIGNNWNFQTKPQPQLYNQSVRYDRGRTLGGTSALNAMLYQRPTRGSHERWAQTVNDSTYGWDAFLPYYQRSVNYTAPNAAVRAANASVPEPGAGAYSPLGGPLKVTHSNWATPFASWGQSALRELGLPVIRDFDTGDLIGHQYCPLTLNPDDQTRGSSEATILRQYLGNGRSNLQVYAHTMAKRVTFDGNKTATGVEVESYGQPYSLTATKEVIVAAGAFQSPQLLMVSGIGPAAELEQHNISTLSALEGVGKNMQDHILIGVYYRVQTLTTNDLQNATIARHYEELYRKNATGILASQNADYLGWDKLPSEYRNNVTANVREALDKYPTDWPDFEYVVGSTKNGFIQTALIAPQSTGNITISSSNTADPPIIDVGWLTNSIDVEMAIAAVRRGREFFATQAIQPILAGEELKPGNNVTTDAELEEYVRKSVSTVYHASCTCEYSDSSGPVRPPFLTLVRQVQWVHVRIAWQSLTPKLVSMAYKG